MKYFEKIKERCIKAGQYMVMTNATVRSTAKVMGCSKSTVFKDVTVFLPEIDPDLAVLVRAVLDFNKAERTLRAGMATKAMWERLREKEDT